MKILLWMYSAWAVHRSKVVWGFMPLVASPIANRSFTCGTGSRTTERPIMMNTNNGSNFPLLRCRLPGPPSGARPGGGAWRRAFGAWACTQGAGPGSDQMDNIGPPSQERLYILPHLFVPKAGLMMRPDVFLKSTLFTCCGDNASNGRHSKKKMKTSGAYPVHAQNISNELVPGKMLGTTAVRN